MKLYHFSETPYADLPDASEYDSIRVSLPSRLYDPETGAKNYNERLDEWCLADEVGLNIMLNEHHATATCVVPSIAVFAGILARQTKNARILQLGNPIANRMDPVRVAEETAMVDVISRGRLDVGFVRGVPFETAATNNSAVNMRERMWEAHDLIIKAWTSHDGPFSWEGKYFHHRQVNIWPRPYQTPHPDIWIPTTSVNGAAEAGERGYVCAAFTTGFELTAKMFDAYREAYKRTHGKEAPKDRLAFLGFAHVADTDDAGRAGAEGLMWYHSTNKVLQPFRAPPGYLPPEAFAAMARGKGPNPAFRSPDIDVQIELGNLFCGTPDTVAAGIKDLYARVGGVGHMMLMGHSGHMTHTETAAHLRRLGSDVLPQVASL